MSRLLLELVRLRHPGPDNHNAAPTERITVLRCDGQGAPELAAMRWWLTPYWSKDAATRYAMFNARSESVRSSRAFREPFRRRRCVVPVSGFYEWARLSTPASDGNRKAPYYILPRDRPGMLLAGLWDRWRDADGGVLESFAILTTSAAEGLRFVHDRQPVMLSMADARVWLDPASEIEVLLELMRPAIPDDLQAVPVSTFVNNARHKEHRCVEPIAEPVAVAASEPVTP